MRKNTKYHYQNYTLVKNPQQDFTRDPNINEPLKRKFDQVFNQLKGKKRTIRSTTGNLNVRSVIDFEISKRNDRVFDREIKSKGGTVILLVDGSGSMRYKDRMNHTRDLVATLYKSLEGVNKVHFKVIMYLGSFYKKDQHLAVVEIDRLEDCNKLVEDSIDGFGSTPTASAMDYCTKLLNRIQGQKLVICITDGQPALYDTTTRNYPVSESKSQQVDQATEAFLEGENNKIRPFGIGVNVGGEGMKKMFRRSFVEVQNIQQIENLIAQRLSEFVKTLKI
jgi:nitric oxide reductase activation protein